MSIQREPNARERFNRELAFKLVGFVDGEIPMGAVFPLQRLLQSLLRQQRAEGRLVEIETADGPMIVTPEETLHEGGDECALSPRERLAGARRDLADPEMGPEAAAPAEARARSPGNKQVDPRRQPRAH